MSTPEQNQQGPRRLDASNHDQEAVMSEIQKALGSIEYGSVLIKIHQGEVVGIETSTKVRLKSN
jgi:hypothetical protein